MCFMLRLVPAQSIYRFIDTCSYSSTILLNFAVLHMKKLRIYTMIFDDDSGGMRVVE